MINRTNHHPSDRLYSIIVQDLLRSSCVKPGSSGVKLGQAQSSSSAGKKDCLFLPLTSEASAIVAVVLTRRSLTKAGYAPPALIPNHPPGTAKFAN